MRSNLTSIVFLVVINEKNHGLFSTSHMTIFCAILANVDSRTKKYMWSGIEFYILGNTFGCQSVNLKIDIFEEKKVSQEFNGGFRW